jgi:hypothetical protein
MRIDKGKGCLKRNSLVYGAKRIGQSWHVMSMLVVDTDRGDKILSLKTDIRDGVLDLIPSISKKGSGIITE